MNIHFYLRYSTKPGESFSIELSNGEIIPMRYLNDSYWYVKYTPGKTEALHYTYLFYPASGPVKLEGDPDRMLNFDQIGQRDIAVYDFFNAMGLVQNSFETQPFQLGKAEEKPGKAKKKTDKGNFIFRVKAPLLAANEQLCLLGSGEALRNWNTQSPVLLEKRGAWYETTLDLSQEPNLLAYKYGVWDNQSKQFLGYEEGENRATPPCLAGDGLVVVHDNYARFPLKQWKGAGVAIPVFSLRTENSWGVGEFTDIPMLADWASSVGLKLIQLLPINDTSATHTWQDSYPYAAISAFALHPIYLNVAQVAGTKHAAVLKPFLKKQKALNALDVVDYEEVMRLKWDILRELYELMKGDWAKDPAYLEYYQQNKHWLAPYAAFCYLRDANGTSDFNTWKKYSTYVPADIEKLSAPKSQYADQIGLHLFVQWHLHLQLQVATQYCHAKGLAVKGDIPIGIYRYSCDAWVAPELYNMDRQTGAPPDDFAENGQNWGFPTYNWAKMKADGFAWWRQRFEVMSHYFDAFRIDHILGFFRIWSIPLDAVEGITGQFAPAIPVTERELQAAGIGFNYDRLCRPYITEQVLYESFGDMAANVAEYFLDIRSDGRFSFKKEYDDQRKIEAWFNAQEPQEGYPQIRDGLYALLSNVILLDAITPAAANEEWRGAFRFNMEKTSSFRHLPDEVKAPLKALYVNYFYRRQDDFWQIEALEKLPALKRATRMLICGEDLGMVPHCVPDVMSELGILSLEIQRMPKAAGATFFHPKDAPYLSVVTPSTHDMSIIRGWWEENRELTQRFYNEIMERPGQAPYYCEPWVNRALLEQHLYAPSMWAIFQLQDLLGMDGELRRENPNDERINVPANPKHYWRYRMHLTLEALQKANGFNADLKGMVAGSGR